MRIMSFVRSVRFIFVAAAAALALLQVTPASAQLPGTRTFDHLRTGFPLTGAHAVTPCETCHIGGRMAGTPTQCYYCHRPESGIAATVMPAQHIRTSDPCENCHRSAISWAGARFSHIGVAPGTCQTCHNGGSAHGKPSGHILTTASCDQCHRGTVAWVPAGYNHAGVVPGTCTNCHGTTATGKPSGHISTTASCDQCHRTMAWIPASFNHSGVAAGTCLTCHGVSASGKPSGHVTTSDSCDSCHQTSAWLPASYNHVGVVAGSCNDCHRPGGSGLAEPNNHVPYQLNLLNGASMKCDACHSSTTSFSVERMDHNGSLGNGSGWCKGCHQSGTSYLGRMEKKALTHESKVNVTDCSQSGCHRPLGNRGNPYSSW